MSDQPVLLKPDWPAPATVAALCTTRIGGVSGGVFDSFNLGDHVGDDPAAVAANRQALVDACPGLSAISWLQQVHGVAAVVAEANQTPPADAQYSREIGLGCAVMTADCLPLLLCNRDGTQVAAAHAGWRGLHAGVIEKTVATFAAGQPLMAWLGPAIGPDQFEVGSEVRDAFLDAGDDTHAVAACFRPSERDDHFRADIYALARLRLRRAGVTDVYGGGLDTITDSSRFYSYRRDGVTGRMASLIYLMPTTADV